MFISTLKKAHDVVEDVATEAVFGLASVFLACGAFLFAAAGAVIWLSTIMPIYAALFITSAMIAIVAVIVYFIGHHGNTPKGSTEVSAEGASSPLASLLKSVSSMGAPLDIVASGLFARQLKKSPVATLAATAAVGALISMMADAATDDD